MPEIFVIIVTYNAGPWIDKCFGSLMNSICPVRVLVVDNGSTDGTPELIRSRFPSVEVVVSSRNLGFGQANNYAINLALNSGAEYLMLLNQDAWVAPDTIGQLLEGILPESGILVLSPMQMDGSGMELDRYFKLYLQEAGYAFTVGEMNSIEPRTRYLDVPFVNAAAWFMHKRTILGVGGFDPVFFHYGEDRQFAARVRYRGGSIRVDTQSVIFHDRADRIREAGLVPAPTPDREWVHFLGQACDPARLRQGWFLARRGLRHILEAGYHFARGDRFRASLHGGLSRKIWQNRLEIRAAWRRSRQALLCVPDLTPEDATGKTGQS